MAVARTEPASAAARRARRSIGLLALALGLLAAGTAPAQPSLAVVIDDLGNRLAEGRRTVSLPGPVTCAFLPGTPHAAALARLAHRAGKEVILHQPMQSVAGEALGPGAITLDMTQAAMVRTLRANLGELPHVAGMNNHMGSLLTRHPGHMTWLAAALREAAPHLYFLDSRTSPLTVAERMAREVGVATTRRDVFLDNLRDPEAIRVQLWVAVDRALRDGSAVAIGHPYPETLEVLEAELPRLALAGIALVPASRVVALRAGRERPAEDVRAAADSLIG